jgi:hypothetical protein
LVSNRHILPGAVYFSTKASTHSEPSADDLAITAAHALAAAMRDSASVASGYLSGSDPAGNGFTLWIEDEAA